MSVTDRAGTRLAVDARVSRHLGLSVDGRRIPALTLLSSMQRSSRPLLTI